jgi:cytochrome c oxidase subunit II
MQWGFPENFSTFGAQIDRTFSVIFWVTALAFVIVQGLLVYCILRYRHKPGRKALPIHGNTTLEIVWTVIPFVGVMFVAFTSASVWLDIKSESRTPAGAYEVAIHAKQFEWNVTNPGPDAQLNTADDFVTRNQLHIPANRPVRVWLTAEDVIHSFFLPNFRLKQDAVPGMEISVWFEPTATGSWQIACAELCGLGHFRMRGSITVHTLEEFNAWQASGGALATGTAETTTVASR